MNEAVVCPVHNGLVNGITNNSTQITFGQV